MVKFASINTTQVLHFTTQILHFYTETTLKKRTNLEKTDLCEEIKHDGLKSKLEPWNSILRVLQELLLLQ